MMIDIGIYYLVVAMGLMLIGLFASMIGGMYLYSIIFLTNIIAWLIALTIEDENEVEEIIPFEK